MDSSLFNQIERYLLELDVLIVARVPTEDVVTIDSAPLGDILEKNLNILIRKSYRIMSGKRIKIPGDWCKGCNANCEFKKPARWSDKSRNGSLDGYEDLTRQIDTIIEKILSILQKLFELAEGETTEDASINKRKQISHLNKDCIQKSMALDMSKQPKLHQISNAAQFFPSSKFSWILFALD